MLVLVLTFLALVAGTLLVPARTGGLVFTVTTTTTPLPARAVAQARGAAQSADSLANSPQSTWTTYQVVQSPVVRLAPGRRTSLHWRPLWELLGAAEPGEDTAQVAWKTATIPGKVIATPAQQWAIDRKVWGLQIGLILAIGGLLALVLRIAAGRRAADPDTLPAAAR